MDADLVCCVMGQKFNEKVFPVTHHPSLQVCADGFYGFRVQLFWPLGIMGAGFINSKQGVCRTVALPFTLKSIVRQKKNYGNSNISPCKNIIF